MKTTETRNAVYQVTPGQRDNTSRRLCYRRDNRQWNANLNIEFQQAGYLGSFIPQIAVGLPGFVQVQARGAYNLLRLAD